MFVTHPFQVSVELLYETRIVEQNRSSLSTFPDDSEVFIVEREVKILDIQGKSFADPQTSFQEQTEEEAVAQTSDGNSFEDVLNLAARQASRLRRIKFHPVDLAHGVDFEQIVLLSPSQKTCDRCLLTRPGGWTKMAILSKEGSQRLCGDRLH
jgi:hypothetical protein